MGTIMQSLQVVILLLTMVAAFNTKFHLVEMEKSGKDIAGVDKAGFARYEVGQDYYDQYYYNQLDYDTFYPNYGDGVKKYNGECRVGSQRAATAPTADKINQLGTNIQTRMACLNLCKQSIGAHGCEYKEPSKICNSITVKPKVGSGGNGRCWAFASAVEAPTTTPPPAPTTTTPNSIVIDLVTRLG